MTAEQQAVLSYLLYGYNEQRDIMPLLTIEHFQSAEARQIFSACRKLWQERKPIEINMLNKHDIEQTYRDGFSIDKYLSVLNTEKDRADLRNTLLEALKVVGTQDPTEVIDMINSRNSTTGCVSMKDVYGAARMIEEYEKHVSSLASNMLKTGIDVIDAKIRGVAGGEVLTICARTGAFKTAVLQFILSQYTDKSNRAAVFFSLEMPIASVTERYFQMANKTKGEWVESAFRQGKGNELFRFKFMNLAANIYAIQRKCSLSTMSQYVRLIEREQKIKVGCVGIDYLGIVETPTEKEYEAISEIARGVKTLAKQLGVPVVLLSQVNRGGTDGETEIYLHQGRGSGAIEEACDFCLGQWKDEKGGFVMKILKNRKGKVGGMWSVSIDPETMTFSGGATEYKIPKKRKGEGVDN